MRRLFPVVHPDDAEREAEYQRLMREELVSSRLGAVDVVESVLGGSGRRVTLDDAQMQAFVQSVNAVRLVLGTLLDVTEDEDESRPDLVSSPEYQLYAYLSWLLDSAIQAMSATSELGGHGLIRASGWRPSRIRDRDHELLEAAHLDARIGPV